MAPIIINENFLDPIAQEAALKSAGLNTEDASESSYILIQSSSPLLPGQMQELANLGLVYHEESSYRTYLFRYGRPDLNPIRSLPFVSWANVYLKEFKVAPNLKPEATIHDPQLASMLSTDPQSSPAHTVEVRLHYNQNPHSDALQSTIARTAHAEKSALIVNQQKIRLTLEEQFIQDLAAMDAVKVIQDVYPMDKPSIVAWKIVQDFTDLEYNTAPADISALDKSDGPNRLGGPMLPAVEPFTLAWVVIKLAEGAIAWAGSKIISSVFEESSSSAVELQQESITKIAQVFVQALESEHFQQANGRLKSLVHNIEEYNNAPDSSLDRLQQATVDSLNLLSTLAGLKWIGLPSYMLAANLRTAVLQERLAVTKDNGEIINLLRHIDRFEDEMFDAYRDGDDKFELIFPGVVNIVFNIWGYVFKGELIPVGSYEQTIWAARVARGKFYQEEMDPIVGMYIKVRQRLNEVRKEVRKRALNAGLGVPAG
jgi:hypothetical protein